MEAAKTLYGKWFVRSSSEYVKGAFEMFPVTFASENALYCSVFTCSLQNMLLLVRQQMLFLDFYFLMLD